MADDEIERLRTALTKINDIRNNVIGAQSMGWSSTIYPLVAALEEAGIKGEGYDQARGRIVPHLAVPWITEIERLQAVIKSVYEWTSDAQPATEGAERCLWEINKLTCPATTPPNQKDKLMLIINTYIAGVKFRKGAKELLAGVPATTSLKLEPEPDNKFDSTAVKVLIDGDNHIGYIPGFLSAKITQMIEDERVVSVKFMSGVKITITYREVAAVENTAEPFALGNSEGEPANLDKSVEEKNRDLDETNEDGTFGDYRDHDRGPPDDFT